MSSTKEANSKSSAPTSSNAPVLPSNVSIFTPTSPDASKALLNGRIFSRLTVSAQTDPAQLAATLKASPKVSDGFYLTQRNSILVFDSETEGVDVKDAHHEHVRAVCLALKDADMSLSIAGASTADRFVGATDIVERASTNDGAFKEYLSYQVNTCGPQLATNNVTPAEIWRFGREHGRGGPDQRHGWRACDE
ncbi:hypothetical protein VPNG_04044 [Cytospora leucostoma]|uniref:Uncharacterized protein n=1 Tax=Cytospora leucostoma TaxID=1230097 RepID=A0A423XDL9_9PEZI|nr:hypothetical protein VPNG_04044 [Cytospora leucostoma]